jgi:hypothetical protein
MKNILFLLPLFVITISCTTNETNNKESKELSDAEKISKAYGIDSFDEIKKLYYTFNVDRDTTLLISRSWIWDKSTGDITLIFQGDTIQFKQDALTEELEKTDHSFINDKYWLLFPFQLIWDSNMTATNMGKMPAPISGDEYTKLTIQYGDGGYTPGDAYDLYLDDNWLIKEWSFRKSGKEEPGSAVVWGDNKDFNGVKVALDHHNNEGLRIYFTDVKFE